MQIIYIRNTLLPFCDTEKEINLAPALKVVEKPVAADFIRGGEDLKVCPRPKHRGPWSLLTASRGASLFDSGCNWSRGVPRLHRYKS